jgi:glycosyltransferase involved in cell wall biosynthesis
VRILIISKALVVGAYQRKAEEMAALPDVQLTVAVPPYWREEDHQVRLERAFTQGYALQVTPMRFNGHYHVHYYPYLGRLLDQLRPDLLHMDEEPFNLSTWLAVRQADRRGIPVAFYAWQNIYQRFPPPFGWMEADVLRRATLGLVGNHAGAEILRRKGFRGQLRVVLQFGIDPTLFTPSTAPRDRSRPFTIGFVCGAGRLIPRKGLAVLLDAVAGLRGDWRIEVIGTGPAQAECEAQARRLGIASRVDFRGVVPSTDLPRIVQTFDVLVAPSLTTRRWKEQFGRVLVEAMACQVAVVGSDSGEIPEVVGDAGLVAPEGDAEALRHGLQRLYDDPILRANLARAGRQRVLNRFTQAAIAEQTVEAYRAVLGDSPDQAGARSTARVSAGG